jgi:hypothetical protein
MKQKAIEFEKMRVDTSKLPGAGPGGRGFSEFESGSRYKGFEGAGSERDSSVDFKSTTAESPRPVKRDTKARKGMELKPAAKQDSFADDFGISGEQSMADLLPAFGGSVSSSSQAAEAKDYAPYVYLFMRIPYFLEFMLLLKRSLLFLLIEMVY